MVFLIAVGVVVMCAALGALARAVLAARKRRAAEDVVATERYREFMAAPSVEPARFRGRIVGRGRAYSDEE